MFLSRNLPSVNSLSTTPLKCISMNNQECKVRPKIVNVNRDEPVFCPFSIKTSKCRGICNNINNPYTKMFVPDVVKNLNVKVFNLMSRTNETRHIKWHETCKCKCRLDASVCNNKQRWNDDKCRCECKELIDKPKCDKGFIWNPSNCECECDKSYDISKYLDYKNCKCRKTLVDELVERSSTEECTENVDEVKTLGKALFENEWVCSYTVCVVLAVIALTISIRIGAYFVYCKYVIIVIKRLFLNIIIPIKEQITNINGKY